MGWVNPISDSGLIAGDHEIRWRRKSDLERPFRRALQEWQLVSGQLSRFPQPGAGGVGGACFGSAAWPLPIQHDSIADEPFDRVRHISEPGSAAHLAIAIDVESQFTLLVESVQDGT